MLWSLRVAWITLPLTAGAAMASATRDWTDASRLVAEMLLWLAWAAGALAVLTPRPVLLTALRVIAPALAVVGVLAAFDSATSTIAAVGAVVATLLTLALASGHDIAIEAANSAAYGDERRALLRTPPALFLGPLPLARLAVAAAVAVAPLLLADEQWTAGVIAVIVAVPVLMVLPRALHGLSRRWAVLVPAGIVIVDPLTLSDPVLFLREMIAELRALDAARAPEGVLDLRLGAAAGSLRLRFTEEAELQRSGRGRHGGTTVQASEICFAVARRAEFLELAGSRRLHTH